MVSGTRCPAWNDQLKNWSETQRHRAEFSDVLISGLESRTKAWGEDLGFGEQIEYMEG